MLYASGEEDWMIIKKQRADFGSEGEAMPAIKKQCEMPASFAERTAKAGLRRRSVNFFPRHGRIRRADGKPIEGKGDFVSGGMFSQAWIPKFNYAIFAEASFCAYSPIPKDFWRSKGAFQKARRE